MEAWKSGLDRLVPQIVPVGFQQREAPLARVGQTERNHVLPIRWWRIVLNEGAFTEVLRGLEEHLEKPVALFVRGLPVRRGPLAIRGADELRQTLDRVLVYPNVVHNVDVVPVLVQLSEPERVDRRLARGLEVQPRSAALLKGVVRHVGEVPCVEYVLREHFVGVLLA